VAPRAPEALAAAAPPPRQPAPAAHPFGFCDPPETRRTRWLTELLDDEARRLLEQARAAAARGRTSEAAATLTQALEVAPESDLLAVELGQLLARTTRLAEARAALGRYLKRHPDDREISQRAALLETQLEIQGSYPQALRRGVTLSYAAEALPPARAAELAEEIRDALDGAARLTATRPRAQLTAVVYPSRSELLAVSCAPAWSGGLYDGTLRLVANGGTVARRSLRHESLHAQLADQVHGQPRWFDEGLADWFAEPERSLAPEVLALLVKNGTHIPFSSLTGSFFEFEAREDAGLAYVQSEEMVRWLVEVRGTGALAAAVAWFDRGGDPGGLFRALDPSGALDEAAFAAWLRTRQPR
jgi:tetratricopeptide (TPR) repeat protein